MSELRSKIDCKKMAYVKDVSELAEQVRTGEYPLSLTAYGYLSRYQPDFLEMLCDPARALIEDAQLVQEVARGLGTLLTIVVETEGPLKGLETCATTPTVWAFVYPHH